MKQLAFCTIFASWILAISPAAGAQDLSDPGKIGPYTVGHTSYLLTDTDAGGRPVAISVWYPVDAAGVSSSTPPAIYPLDPYSNHFSRIPTSADWEALGYDRAYEGPVPSKNGPFPLVMVSPAWSTDNWVYLCIGTRLASHGYVVAVIDHYAESQWSWSPTTESLTALVNRFGDVSFAITQLLGKSTTSGELLYSTIDPKRIAMSGHSDGGYITFALAGGDDSVCDSSPPPYPANTCVPISPDPRINVMITLDGVSQLLRYNELARISIPSLILGQTVENSESASLATTGSPAGTDVIARPHAAIGRSDSYRVDVNGANHYSFTNFCDGWRVMYNLALIAYSTLETYESGYPCSSTGFDPVTISAADGQEVTTTYMIAFLNVYLGHSNTDSSILTEAYALTHTPTVQFFANETCSAVLPDNLHFSYRPHQVSSECTVDQKDPDGWFTALPAPSLQGVYDSWNYTSGVAPGAWVTISATTVLQGAPQSWNLAGVQQLPTTLGTIAVSFNGAAAALLYVSPTQINALVPATVAPGPVQVIVQSNGTSSAPFAITATPTLPSIYALPSADGATFFVTAALAGTATLVGNSAVDPRVVRAARPGDTLDLYMIGLGSTQDLSKFVTDQVFSGAYPVSAAVTAKVGGEPASVLFAGLTSPGLYLVRIVVPADLAPGPQPIQVTAGNSTTRSSLVLMLGVAQ